MTHKFLYIVTAVALFSFSLLPRTTQVRFRGIISSFDGTTLVVKTTEGKGTSVAIPVDVRISALTNTKTTTPVIET